MKLFSILAVGTAADRNVYIEEIKCATIYGESNCSSEISAIPNQSQGSLPQSLLANFANIKCIKVT